MELIVLGLVAGLSFLSYAMWRRSRADGLDEALAEEQTARRLSAAERTLQTLRPGDVVSHLATDYLVEGTLELDDDGRVTRLHRLADGGQVRWLGLRPGDDDPLLLDEVPELLLVANAPEHLVHAGLPYRLAARTSARVRRVGTVGDGRLDERARFYDYAGVGTRRILAVAWDARTDAFTGEPVAPATLEILPGG